MGFKEKWNEFLYSFSTEDRYADYESYNHHTRTATTSNNTSETRTDGIQLNNADTFDDEDTHGAGVSHTTEGVSEAILAWRHIDTWTSENHTDLNASLSDPCTRMDITKAEEDLAITFPPPVRASLRIHDGQEDLDSLTGSGGLFYGLPLMSLDDIVAKTNAWRLVASRLQAEEEQRKNKVFQTKLISPTGSSSELDKNRSTSSLVETQQGYGKVEANDQADPDLERKLSTTRHFRQPKPHAPRQQSVPPGAIQTVYANPNWIPLITDNAGNHVGVDLAPGPKGIWGQVILFGREFDTKFVLAKTWGDFLLNFVKDLEIGNFWIYNEEDALAGEGDLVFFDKRLNKEVPYLQVLSARAMHHWRAQQKDLPQQPKEIKKTNVSHIVPGQSERIISTDITNNKLIEEDLLDEDISNETETKVKEEPIVTTEEVQKEEAKEESKEEAKEESKEEVKEEAKEEKKEEKEDEKEEEPAKKATEDDDHELVNDFKDVAI